MKYTLYHLRQLDPFKFETLIAELWSRMGFRVKKTRLCKDGGVDVLAHPIPVLVDSAVPRQRFRLHQLLFLQL